MMPRYVCIHGHFYQPPRENPWLEGIEMQDSAYPFHDWNDRITAECYVPNALSRILSEQHVILEISNNYEYLSFNFGPTLLSWIKEKKPELLKAIVEADQKSAERLEGHGNAIAQAYNHMILPLANDKDIFTQIYWGIKDFEYYFHRKPEGMWLPETAVDLRTLEVLATLDIKFTILAPNQAHQIRIIGKENWRNVEGNKVNPKIPYIQKLPSGKSISIFYYDGPLSRAVAFENVLQHAEHFAQSLIAAFSSDQKHPELVNIATDGETYGHHHPFGDMGLAYTFQYIQHNQLATIVNYAYYLAKFPPTVETQIFENSSWSCAHGIERWRSNCGCQTGGHGDWNQNWRAPLRQALDWLRDSLIPIYEREVGALLKDPWQARNDYIAVIHDRSEENVTAYFAAQAKTELNVEQKIKMLKWLELQRHALLMYTSCGWFFEEISGLETSQVIQYAARVIQLTESLGVTDLEKEFLQRLEGAPSNIPQFKNGKQVYEMFAKPARVDIKKVAAHYTMHALLEPSTEQTNIYCFHIENNQLKILQAGRIKISMGDITLKSMITHEQGHFIYAGAHFGNQNIYCGIKDFTNESELQEIDKALSASYSRGQIYEILKIFERHFGQNIYSLKDLFKDQQRKFINVLLRWPIDELNGSYQQIYEHYFGMFEFMHNLNIPLPPELQSNIQYMINTKVRQILQQELPDIEALSLLIEETKRLAVEFSDPEMNLEIQNKIAMLIKNLEANHSDEYIQYLEKLLQLLQNAPIHIDLWQAQTDFYKFVREVMNNHNSSHFQKIGELLKVQI